MLLLPARPIMEHPPSTSTTAVSSCPRADRSTFVMQTSRPHREKPFLSAFALIRMVVIRHDANPCPHVLFNKVSLSS